MDEQSVLHYSLYYSRNIFLKKELRHKNVSNLLIVTFRFVFVLQAVISLAIVWD